ncbi:MAG: hypothetical protein R3E68_12190 [Burkholderiaceae bacterium]
MSAPTLQEIIPKDVQGVRIQVGDDGKYSNEDLAKVADTDAFVIGMEPVSGRSWRRRPSSRSSSG